ncbi:MAG: MotA/TolQ/ExbB proton channel family protein [Thiotrichaceae bacterium]|nr:MotA/TolQ/ExbB proton channel family protein [Thiotrichaceae bacterium]
MFEILKAGGWVMYPILLCSVIAMTIIIERFWSLRRRYVLPSGLTQQVSKWVQEGGKVDNKRLEILRNNSPLGKVLAAGLVNMDHGREMMKASVEEVGSQIVHELERYLNTLGTIAEIAPLLGLFGTVTGIIRMFAAIGVVGLGNPSALSAGLSEALIATAAGLAVAIPTVVFYRYFRGLVDELVVSMEQEALKLIDTLHGDRETEGN